MPHPERKCFVVFLVACCLVLWATPGFAADYVIEDQATAT
jgi:hypothetical protein